MKIVVAMDPEYDSWSFYEDFYNAESLWKAWRRAAREILSAAGLDAKIARTRYRDIAHVRTFTPLAGPDGPTTVENEVWCLAHCALTHNESTGRWDVDLERAREFGHYLASQLAGSTSQIG